MSLLGRNSWAAAFLLFMACVCVGVWLLFARPTTYIEQGGRIEGVAPAAISAPGLLDVVRIWKEYSNYAAGCVVLIIISVMGAVVSVANIKPAMKDKLE